MARKVASAQQINQRWLQTMTGGQAATNYQQGVQSVTENPAAKAASPDATQRYLTGVQQSVANGSRAAALGKVTLQQWQQAAVQKGAASIATGAQLASQKHLQSMQAMQPVYQAASDAAHALPKGGKANALARVSAALDVLMSAKGKK